LCHGTLRLREIKGPTLGLATQKPLGLCALLIVTLKQLAERRNLPYFEISSVTGLGLEALKYAIAERVLGREPMAAS